MLDHSYIRMGKIWPIHACIMGRGDRQTKNQLPAVRWSHLSNRNPIQPRYHLDKSGYIPPFRVSTLSAVILNVWSGGTERHKERQTDKQSNIQKDRKTERQSVSPPIETLKLRSNYKSPE